MVFYRAIIGTEDRQIVSARNTELLRDAEEIAESWQRKMLGKESGYGVLAWVAVQKLEKELTAIGVDLWQTVSEFEF